MYSKKILDELKKKHISVGDRVKVISNDVPFEGLLMPRSQSGDAGILVLKLDNGYNVGLACESMELLSKNTKVVAKDDSPEQHAGGKGSKGSIAILGCGGTIASKIEYKTGAVSPSITPKELRQAFPALENWSIHSKQIFSLFSEDMNTHHWRLLADAVEDEIRAGSSGIVIMHGTDTMTYTAAALSYMFQHLPVPVVFVGSQRSSDRPSSENEMNMLNAVFTATQNLGEVTVCMHATTNDDQCFIHRGTRVRKVHTSRRDAFHSLNSKPLFAVDYRSKHFEPLPGSPQAHPRAGNNTGVNSGVNIAGSDGIKNMVVKKHINDNVALIYAHPGMKPKLVSSLDDYDGVVLIGTGLGHVSTDALGDKTVKSLYKPVSELISSGIPVVMSSQCLSGRVCMRVYSTGRMLMDAGVIGDGADWTPEAAYAKLCWVLGQTKKMDEIKQMMMTNVAGEISERSALEEF